jgi:EamA domain-containing membrane protein RarD
MRSSSPEPSLVVDGRRFGAAARAYFLYGVVYWLGGVYLALHGVGVQRFMSEGVFWIALGLVLVFGVPYLLRRRRAWFERWILSRRDFARLIALFMALRALAVLRVALRPEAASVAAPWGGEISYRLGAAVFFAVTVLALVFVARAAWEREPA